MHNSTNPPLSNSSTLPLSESVTHERSLGHDLTVPEPNDDFSTEHDSLDVAREDPTTMEVFFAWEQRRIAYNGILVGCTLALGTLFGTIHVPGFWLFCIVGAVFLNVCYCLGPVLEGYQVWFFNAEREHSRVLLFIGGLSLSVILVMATLAQVRQLF